MEGTQLREFITRYVAMWHEPEPRRRRAIVTGLFAEDAENYTTQTAARGLDEINARVTRAYEEWVAAKSYVFQPTGNTDAHHHLGKFFWQMRPRSGGPIVSVGRIGSLKGIFPRRWHRSPLARLRRRPLLARGEGGVPSTQQGLARLRAVWTGGAGSVRLRTQEFPSARASGRPVRKSWGGECRDTIFEVRGSTRRFDDRPAETGGTA
jgi:hypothetical protein